MTYRLRTALAALLTLLLSQVWAADELSPAERALFMTDHLAALRPPARLQYTFRKSGSLEAGFEDRVAVTLQAQPAQTAAPPAPSFWAGRDVSSCLRSNPRRATR